MKGKKSDNPKRVEESKPLFDYALFSFAPSKYMTALAHINLRLEKSLSKATTDAERAFQKKTIEYLYALAEKLDADYKPKPPKTIENAYEYALSRKWSGTFFALLDENNNLVKTVIVAKKRLPTLPEFSLSEKTVPMTMTARFIMVPELEIERSVPKRVVKVVPFSSDTKQIFGYGES